MFVVSFFHINLLTKLFLQKLQTQRGRNVEGSQISHLAQHVLEHYSSVHPLSAEFCPTKIESPHAVRKVELLAVPLVCHLAGITKGSHLVRKAFIEHSGTTFSRHCMSLACIFIADITNTQDLVAAILARVINSKFCGSVRKSIPCSMQRALSLIRHSPT